MACLFYFVVATVVIVPAYFIWTFWRDAKAREWNWTTEASRTMYVDVAKTMVTASGIAVALVASSSAPVRTVDAIVRASARTGVVSLVLCLCTSLITMIALTRGHDVGTRWYKPRSASPTDGTHISGYDGALYRRGST